MKSVKTSPIITSYWRSPIGIIEIGIQDQSLHMLKLSNKKSEQLSEDKLSKKVVQELKNYFEANKKFTIPITAEGTPFQQAVWKAITSIPSGETRTYGEVAKMIGKPAAARAVGNALNKNPVCIVVPCHRVLPASGKIGGYAFGPRAKEWLLKHEMKNER